MVTVCVLLLVNNSVKLTMEVYRYTLTGKALTCPDCGASIRCKVLSAGTLPGSRARLRNLHLG